MFKEDPKYASDCLHNECRDDVMKSTRRPSYGKGKHYQQGPDGFLQYSSQLLCSGQRIKPQIHNALAHSCSLPCCRDRELVDVAQQLYSHILPVVAHHKLSASAASSLTCCTTSSGSLPRPSAAPKLFSSAEPSPCSDRTSCAVALARSRIALRWPKGRRLRPWLPSLPPPWISLELRGVSQTCQADQW